MQATESWAGPGNEATLEHDFYKQYYTVEHDFYKLTTTFYKLTTTIKLLRRNRLLEDVQLQQIMVGGAEGGVCLATFRFVALSVDSDGSIPKAASLFERHLNIDPLSSFESR